MKVFPRRINHRIKTLLEYGWDNPTGGVLDKEVGNEESPLAASIGHRVPAWCSASLWSQKQGPKGVGQSFWSCEPKETFLSVRFLSGIWQSNKIWTWTSHRGEVERFQTDAVYPVGFRYRLRFLSLWIHALLPHVVSRAILCLSGNRYSFLKAAHYKHNSELRL